VPVTSPSLVRRPVRRSRLFMGAAGVVALVLAIANSAGSVGFPVGSQWQRVINALLTVDMLVVFLVLLAAVLIGTRRDAQRAELVGAVVDQQGHDALPPTPGPGVLAPIGLVLAAMDWVLWLVFGFPGLLHALLVREEGYLLAAIPMALFAPLLVLGTVFSVVGFHRGGTRANRIVSLAGTALGLLMMALAAVLALLCAVGAVR
jgi:hypothetical protein